MLILDLNERIQLRDYLFNKFIELKVIILTKKNEYMFLKVKLKSINNDLLQKYNLYINQFMNEEEAKYCIIHHDDISNHLCPICNDRCKFYNIRHGYRNTCGNKGCHRKLVEQTSLKIYGVKCSFQNKDVQFKCRISMMNKYGVLYASQSKIIQQKIKATKLKRYGNCNYNNRDSAKITCIAKYGSSNPMQNIKVKNKQNQTMINRYGKPYALQCKKFKDKAEKTTFSHYNVKNPFQSKIIIDKIRRKRAKKNKFTLNQNFNKIIINFQKKYFDIKDKYDIYSNNKYFIEFIDLIHKEKGELLKLKEISNIFGFWESSIKQRAELLNILFYFDIKDSKLELKFKDFLEDNNINYKRHNYYPNNETNTHFEIDFILKDYDIGFEINDLNSHNSNKKDKLYHVNKTYRAEKENIKLIHLWEWELTDEKLWNKTSNWILNLLNNHKEEININDCQIKQVNQIEEKGFSEQYDLQGYIQSQYCYGFYYNDQLIQLLSLNKLEDNNYELLRFYTRFGYNIQNGLKELLNYFIQNHNVDSIITYCNLDKFDGKQFEKIGFQLLKHKTPFLIYNKINNVDYKIVGINRSVYNCGQNVYKLDIIKER